jgi:hypothetical protein
MENYNVLMKMAGGEDLSQMNINDFFLQAMEYENQKSVMDGFFKILNTMWKTHPFPVVRLHELRSWASSGQYSAILDGNYPRRDLAEEDIKEDAKEAYRYYKSNVDDNDDPIVKKVKEAGETIGRASQDIQQRLKDAFKKQQS